MVQLQFCCILARNNPRKGKSRIIITAWNHVHSGIRGTKHTKQHLPVGSHQPGRTERLKAAVSNPREEGGQAHAGPPGKILGPAFHVQMKKWGKASYSLRRRKETEQPVQMACLPRVPLDHMAQPLWSYNFISKPLSTLVWIKLGPHHERVSVVPRYTRGAHLQI